MNTREIEVLLGIISLAVLVIMALLLASVIIGIMIVRATGVLA